MAPYLDAHGDLEPPWARYPSYERYTLGWRMGSGEDWLIMFGVFLDGLATDFETRLAYLKRHPPAPISWADWVHSVLYPGLESDDEDDEEDEDPRAVERRATLLKRGLIASDVAYSNWLRQQTAGVHWPWDWGTLKGPEEAARYWTRDLAFFSRRVAGIRSAGAWVTPEVPRSWSACAMALDTGRATKVNPRKGLRALAITLCAGEVVAPWQLGLTPEDFKDSFDMDMGYADAFRLWVMSAFDDRAHWEGYLAQAPAPSSWSAWLDAHGYNER